MTHNESGVQYQGVNDSSGQTGSFPVVGLMIGKFKRGCLDKPMTITKGNIKGMLGYDPKNPDYTAVQDVLDTNVPSVQVIRIKGSDSGGSMENIDVSELSFPTSNAFIAFNVPSSTHRFSINVDGDNITGTLADVMTTLADEYGILTTYATESQVVFTVAKRPLSIPSDSMFFPREYQIAISGVSPAPKDDTNYLFSGPSNQSNQNEYCEVNQSNNIYTFTLKNKRAGSWMPSANALVLGNTLNVKVSTTAKSIDLNDYEMTGIPLTNWVDGSYQKLTIDTPVQFFNPNETVPFGYVIANKDSDERYAHEYSTVSYYTMAKAINDAISGIDTDINSGPIRYSSNINMIYSNPPMYFDFSQETQFRPFLKGYVPYLEVAM